MDLLSPSSPALKIKIKIEAVLGIKREDSVSSLLPPPRIYRLVGLVRFGCLEKKREDPLAREELGPSELTPFPHAEPRQRAGWEGAPQEGETCPEAALRRN